MSTFTSLIRHALSALCCIISFPSSAVDKAMHGVWQRISEPSTVPGYYYDPLSIKQVKAGFVVVTTMINYISDEGNKESLLGVTLYDCGRRVKQEQSTVQYTQYWADGDIKFKIGLEEPWDKVKIGTDGMRLLKTVCAPTVPLLDDQEIVMSFQRTSSPAEPLNPHTTQSRILKDDCPTLSFVQCDAH